MSVRVTQSITREAPSLSLARFSFPFSGAVDVFSSAFPRNIPPIPQGRRNWRSAKRMLILFNFTVGLPVDSRNERRTPRDGPEGRHGDEQIAFSLRDASVVRKVVMDRPIGARTRLPAPVKGKGTQREDDEQTLVDLFAPPAGSGRAAIDGCPGRWFVSADRSLASRSRAREGD